MSGRYLVVTVAVGLEIDVDVRVERSDRRRYGDRMATPSRETVPYPAEAATGGRRIAAPLVTSVSIG